MPELHRCYSVRGGIMTPISAAAFLQAGGRPPSAKAPTKPKLSREDQIRRAVDQARRRDPSLSQGYATSAIMAGKTVDQVKGELIDRLFGADRAKSLANMKALVGTEREGAAEPSIAKSNMLKLIGNSPKGAA